MFIIEKKYVYIHVPKTGGTYVTNVFERLKASGLVDVDFHSSGYKHKGRNGLKNIIPKDELDNYTILSNIRDPRSHYLSRYNFGWWKRNKIENPELLLEYSNYPNVSFEEFVDLINDSRFRNKRTKLVNLCEKQEVGANSYSLLSRLGKRPFQNRKLEKQFDALKEQIKDKKLILFNTKRLTDDLRNFLISGLKLDAASIESCLQTEHLPKNDRRLKSGAIKNDMMALEDVSDDCIRKILHRERFIVDLLDFLDNNSPLEIVNQKVS